MRRANSILILAAFVLTVIGCSEIDHEQPIEKMNPDGTVTLTTTVNLSSDTKALTSSGYKTFAKGDQIAVIYKNTNGETVKAVSSALPDGTYGKQATFSVTLTAPKASEKVRYIYPAGMAKETIATNAVIDDFDDDDDTINYDALYTQQDGTLSKLSSSLDLATFDGTLTAEAGLPTTATLSNKLAIVKITLFNSNSQNITSNITHMSVTDENEFSYSITRAAGAGPIYVAMRRSRYWNPEYVYIHFISANDGTHYYQKLVSTDNDNNLIYINKMYTVNVTMSTVNLEAVDLGLTSGKKWATCNIGATSAEEYGEYFAWGETSSAGLVYTWNYYKWCKNGNQSQITKYNTTDNKTVLDPEDDVAHVQLGGKWRMPTVDEWDELINNTNWSVTSLNEVAGVQFVNKQDDTKKIFIPFAGEYGDGVRYVAGTEFYCWSSSRFPTNAKQAKGAHYRPADQYNAEMVSTSAYLYRYMGMSVRPILANN